MRYPLRNRPKRSGPVTAVTGRLNLYAERRVVTTLRAVNASA
jgi:hypothetical protein